MSAANGTTLLVTGASRGIGRAVVVEAAHRFSHVLLIGRATEDLVETARLASIDAEIVSVDLASRGERSFLLQRLRGEQTKVAAFVHCAGDGLPTPVDEITLDEAGRLLELHYCAPLEILQALLPGMRAARYGRVVAIGSLAPLRPQRYMTAYAASKAALRVAMQCIADEVIADGITVNVVSPGSVDTKLGRSGRSELARIYERDQAQPESRKERLPLRRPVLAEEVARLVSFLLDPGNGAISGQDIVIAGTLLMR